MTTYDKAKFIYKAFNDPASFCPVMRNLPKKERTINEPKQVVVLMTNCFAPSKKNVTDEEHVMNSQEMSAQERVDYVFETCNRRKWSFGPVIR